MTEPPFRRLSRMAGRGRGSDTFATGGLARWSTLTRFAADATTPP